MSEPLPLDWCGIRKRMERRAENTSWPQEAADIRAALSEVDRLRAKAEATWRDTTANKVDRDLYELALSKVNAAEQAAREVRSVLVDIARRIGPACTPEWMRAELERIINHPNLMA